MASHDCHEKSLEQREDEFFQSILNLPRNVPVTEINGSKGDASDTGGSSSFNYGNVDKIESHARLVRFDQQMMRALSTNMTEHGLFLSTPKFISDLLFVSEVLRGIEKDERNDYLKSVLEEINKNLPSNVYIPISQTSTNLPTASLSRKYKHGLQVERIDQNRMHKVLSISTDNAFCLHSKERVPYHIIIEVAYDPMPEQLEDEEEKNYEGSNPDTFRENLQLFKSPKSKLKKQVEKLKNFVRQSKEAEGRNVELRSLTKPTSAKRYNKMDQTVVNRLPKKKFYERTNSATRNNNSMYVLAVEDLDKKFLNEGLKISPPRGQNENLSESVLKENQEKVQTQKPPQTLPGKAYESDKNNHSVEDVDSMDERDHHSFESPREQIAGYNFSSHFEEDNLGLETRRSLDEADLFSSDDEFESKTTCTSCIPNSVKALGSCLTGSLSQLPEEREEQAHKKTQGLFGDKTFKQVCLDTQKKSRFGRNRNYGLISVIVKSPDNLTQEQFASQLIRKFLNIF